MDLEGSKAIFKPIFTDEEISDAVGSFRCVGMGWGDG